MALLFDSPPGLSTHAEEAQPLLLLENIYYTYLNELLYFIFPPWRNVLRIFSLRAGLLKRIKYVYYITDCLLYSCLILPFSSSPSQEDLRQGHKHDLSLIPITENAKCKQQDDRQ